MTEDNRMPNFWWCPTHHLYRGGDKRPCAYAVRLVPAPPVPRVFLRGDIVPGGVCTQTENGDEYRSKDDRVLISLGPHVEVFPMTREEWQAAVDRASEERAIPEPTEGQNP